MKFLIFPLLVILDLMLVWLWCITFFSQNMQKYGLGIMIPGNIALTAFVVFLNVWGIRTWKEGGL